MENAELTALVSQVAEESAELGAAREAETIAAAAVLDRLITATRPALRAIGTRHKIQSRIWWPDRVSTTEDVERAAYRTVCLSDDKAGPELDHPRANDGSFEGFELHLREDGSLEEWEYSGTWSRWQGTEDTWEASVTRYPSPEAAVRDGWTDVESYAARLAARLQAAAGSRKQNIAAAIARAARLDAVATLLRR